MLKDEKLIVFADKRYQPVDGLPLFSIMFGDLKEIIPKAEHKDTTLDDLENPKLKLICKPKLDMGVMAFRTKDDIAQYGASTIDPRNFRGNIDLQRFVHAHYRAKMTKDVEVSPSTKLQKFKINSLEDHNILLPED